MDIDVGGRIYLRARCPAHAQVAGRIDRGAGTIVAGIDRSIVGGIVDRLNAASRTGGYFESNIARTGRGHGNRSSRRNYDVSALIIGALEVLASGDVARQCNGAGGIRECYCPIDSRGIREHQISIVSAFVRNLTCDIDIAFEITSPVFGSPGSCSINTVVDNTGAGGLSIYAVFDSVGSCRFTGNTILKYGNASDVIIVHEITAVVRAGYAVVIIVSNDSLVQSSHNPI